MGVCVCLVISEAAVGRCRMQNLEQSHSLSHSLPLPGPSMSGGEPGGPRLPRAPHGPSLVLPNSPSSVPDRAFGAIEAKDLVSFSKPRRVSFFYWCNGIIKELKKRKCVCIQPKEAKTGALHSEMMLYFCNQEVARACE